MKKQERTSLLVAGTPWIVDVYRTEIGDQVFLKHSGGYTVSLTEAKRSGYAHNSAGDPVQVPLDIVDQAAHFQTQAVAMFNEKETIAREDADDEPDSAITDQD